MTIVVVGHHLSRSITWQEFSQGPAAAKTSWTLDDYEIDGLFAASDSAITTSGSIYRQTLLNGFRKIYEIPVNVYTPDFVGKTFNDYTYKAYTSQALMAIAGSTLTAQHGLNSVIEHLGKLVVGYVSAGVGNGPGEYRVMRHCDKSNSVKFSTKKVLWDSSMFQHRDYSGLITADSMLDVVQHSLDNAMSSARTFKLDAKALAEMKTDFALGLYCHQAKVSRLFTFRMEFQEGSNGLMEVVMKRAEVPPGKVAVLGMSPAVEADAQVAFDKAVYEGRDSTEASFEFLNSKIDQAKSQSNGPSGVDRPSYLFLHRRGKVEFVRKRK